MNRTTRRAHAPLSASVVLALLGALLAVAPPAPVRAAPVRASAAPVAITEGSVTWGIKESWRRYIGAGSEAADGATVTSWVDNIAQGFTFPVQSGSFDEATRTTTLDLAGSVHFTAWYGYDEPGKYALDTKFSDLSLVIGPDVQEIRGTHTGYLRDDPGGDLHEDVDVVLARLDVAEATTDFTGGTASWSDLPAVAGPGFSLYTEGTPLDRVAIDYTGPGGVPDLGEHFDRPGLPVLRAGAEWLSRTNERSSQGGAQALEVSAGNDVVFTINISHSNARTVFVTAHDPVTLEQVGEEFTFQPGARTASAKARLVHGFDPETDTIFYQTFRGGPESRDTTVHAATWDPGAGRFTTTVVGDLEPRPVGGSVDLATGPMVWNAVAGELLVSQAMPYPAADELEPDNLFRFRRDGAGWSRSVTPFRYPDGGAFAGITGTSSALSDTALLPARNVGVLPDGSYLVATGATSYSRPQGVGHWPALRLSFDEGGAAVVETVEGTLTEPFPEELGGAYYGFTDVSPGPDGSLVLHGPGQTLEAYAIVRLEDGAAVAGEIAIGEDILPPYGFSLLGTSMAYDGRTGRHWAWDPNNPDARPLALVADGEVVATYEVKDYASFGYFDNAYLRVAEGEAVYVPVNDQVSGKFGWRRYDDLGLAPTIETQPEDVAVDLAPGEATERVSFAAEIGTGGDAALQWQARGPGESRFADVVGATGPTLTVAARPADDGRTYRLVVTNDAGRVVSDEARLDVRYAPRISADLRDVTVAEGTDASFLVAATASPEQTVTWQRRIGGYWQPIAADDDNVVVETVDGTSSLRVLATNVDQSGSLFRARLANDVGAVHTRAATLRVDPRVSVPDDGLSLDGVVLEWAGSEELQAAPPFGGSNYLSAGVSDGDEATYRATDGDVAVVHRTTDGAEVPATWATRAAPVAGDVDQLVRLSGGRADLAADGSATVRWDGTWSVNFYGGLVPFWLSDPELTVAADGTGVLTADLDGYGSSKEQPDQRHPLDETPDVTIATFGDVEIDPQGVVVVESEYAGVEALLPAGATPQDRTSPGWGAWPQGFVDFHLQTGLSSYWYSSGGAADGKKTPRPFTVDLTGAEPVEGGGPTPPTDSGPAAKVTPGVDLALPRKVRIGRKAVARVTVTLPSGVASYSGQVVVRAGGRVLGVERVTVASGGTVSVRLGKRVVRRLGPGRHFLTAAVRPSATSVAATSDVVVLKVREKRRR
ncbi:HtaA domain-containing protein [Nocardioides sp. BYT-33-1]|uniref:HtaA domain-containing protein n=1 Tax=Nocardioides sp. BYT-33-1 TaxID=3416952 RepID=UPI003F52FBA8